MASPFIWALRYLDHLLIAQTKAQSAIFLKNHFKMATLFIIQLVTRGPFLERPGNLSGLESDSEINASRKVGCVLTSNEVHFVSLADNFTVQFLNLLKLSSGMKTKQLNGPGNYQELREMGPRSLRCHCTCILCH